MSKFVNLLRREQGFTLIELIAALSLFSLVSALIYGVLMFGVHSYQRVTMENTLRDESDLLMSAIITEIYTFAPNTIYSDGTDKTIVLRRDNINGGTDEVEIGIADGQLFINESPTSSSATQGSSGSAEIPTTTDPYQTHTSTESKLGPASSIALVCSTDTVQSCKSGLLNINLSLVLERGDTRRQLDLESKFGF
ncbi:PulJ/GspJ family protein [Paenibacillus piscarius]|uniref:PulJ/GspJ family protein n=1 Tax=Paenibacillus piscarius TaxID=1089681 RepID=UPI001EE92B77|nr:prepilin-type N-terminal cleavage/methylation domain-containing protein [Paenibacillus piscarius]